MGISIGLSLKFVAKNPIESKSELVQVMAWWRAGDKPLPAPMQTHFTDAYAELVGEELIVDHMYPF